MFGNMKMERNEITHQMCDFISRLKMFRTFPDGNVPNTERALPRWMAISTLCLKKKADRWSWVAANNRSSRASIKSIAFGPQTPIVSTATGIKR